jgi:hypothetical protein
MRPHGTWSTTCRAASQRPIDHKLFQLAHGVWYVDKLLGDAGVDGIIAGYGAFNGVREYDESWECANAIGLIRDWVSRHSSTHRMATSEDRMFR